MHTVERTESLFTLKRKIQPIYRILEGGYFISGSCGPSMLEGYWVLLLKIENGTKYRRTLRSSDLMSLSQFSIRSWME